MPINIVRKDQHMRIIRHITGRLVNLMAIGGFLIFMSASGASALTITEDFSGDLGKWTASPSHLDSYGIVGGTLFMNGRGQPTGPSGWGTLQFDHALGSSFSATWDTKITFYDYVSFVLFADAPWESFGYAKNGYNCWLDINDMVYPMMDVRKLSGGNISLMPNATDVRLPFDIASNDWFHWKVEKDSDILRVFINDLLVIDTRDAEFSRSDFKLGLGFAEDSEGYIDNLVINIPLPTPADINYIANAEGPGLPADTTPVPEPSTLILTGSGLIAVLAVLKRLRG